MTSTHRYCIRCLTSFAEDPARCPNLGCRSLRPEGGWEPLLAPGELLDRHYLVERPLAVGGAGVTYLAREVDPHGMPFGPDLAIKVLYSNRDTGPMLRRLQTEAQILQELAHPHVVECRGFVHRAGQPPYLVTRYASGGNLYEFVVDHGTLAPAVAADVLRQVVEGVAAAHDRGVVHRDLKPENVLLVARPAPGQTPEVQVADFGVAKVFGGVGERTTRFGTFVGTPEYAAPEQFEGIAPSPATDVFAVGSLATFLLTGAPPFRFTQRFDIESSYAELRSQVPPTLPEALAGDRPWLQALVDGTMAWHPGERWTLQRVLRQLEGREATVAAPQTEWIRLPVASEAPTLQRPDPEDTPVPGPPPVEPARPSPHAATALSPQPAPSPSPAPANLAKGAAMGGILVAAMLAGSVALVALGASAVAFGYFQPAPRVVIALAPLDVGAPSERPKRPPARALAGAELSAVGDAVTTAATRCRVGKVVPVDVSVGVDGVVTSLQVDPGRLGEAEVRCVRDAVIGVRTPVAGPGRARLRLVL